MLNDESVSDGTLELLACPRDFGRLQRKGMSCLICEQGHEYKVVNGVPVLLAETDDPTLWVGPASLEAAWGRGYDTRMPGYYLETLGITDQQRDAIVELSRTHSSVDPVASLLVGATCGHMYSQLVGNLETYPIPEIRLPYGHGSRLLDIGCNWGRWSIAAARKGYSVIGIDPSLGAVLAAKRISAELGVSVNFVVADARRLPFRECSIDCAFSYSVLQHFSQDNVVRTLREIRRIMSPQAQVIIQMAHRMGIRSLYYQFRRGFRETRGFDVRYWSFDDLMKIFGTELGAASISVDGFFGLGLQVSDAYLLDPGRRVILHISDTLRQVSKAIPVLRRVADSLYVTVNIH